MTQNEWQQTPPPPSPQNNDIFSTDRFGKSRGVAGLLAILLGGLGVQYFYLNKPVAGLLAILLTFVTCGIFSLIFLVQGILMLTMTQDAFERKFETTTSTFPLF